MLSRFSLAAKLYSIFALFAALVAAITALSDYNTRQNAALTEAVSVASRAALNVERINSLVYAVVMESRGVYMLATTTPPLRSTSTRPGTPRCDEASSSSGSRKLESTLRNSTSSRFNPATVRI